WSGKRQPRAKRWVTMRRILIEHIQDGMILARSLVASDGTVLLQAGVTLRAKFIPRLRELGYTSIYIQEKGLEDVEIPEPVSELTRQQATRSVKEAFQAMKRTHSLDYSAISEAVRSIVDEV